MCAVSCVASVGTGQQPAGSKVLAAAQKGRMQRVSLGQGKVQRWKAKVITPPRPFSLGARVWGFVCCCYAISVCHLAILTSHCKNYPLLSSSPFLVWEGWTKKGQRVLTGNIFM